MSVWLPTATCTPEACLTERAPVVALPQRVLRLTACLTVLLVGIALTLPVRALPGGARTRLVRFWTRTLLGALGVTVHSTPPPTAGAAGGTAERAAGAAAGRPTGEREPGVLVVANHVSWLDIPLIATALPGRSIAKTEVRHWPVLGPITAWGGTVYLDRDRLRTLPDTVCAVAAQLRAGRPMIVFPEGSTWCGRESGRFRPALFEAAVQAGAPVQPVTIRYRLADGRATSAAAFVGEDGLLASLSRVVAVRGLVAELTFLPAIPAPVPTSHATRRGPRRELARAAQAAVEGVR
ncbi:lysophospholipid acyltransferase family protein [Kitasatospora sp. NPDC090091]|uniref:lysophospholipid acyltransferase family protein n=1 Tax=Kitasatospora sp. NPDC090091 TaxID=3364081 RepID=UPI00382037EE